MAKKNAGSSAAAPGHTALVPTLTFAAKTIKASAAGCLSGDDAADLVQSCLGGSPHNPDTALKDLFPLASALTAFCGRVKTAAQEAGCTRAIPCTGTTTLGDIADALTC
jgi:hypothetical protein